MERIKDSQLAMMPIEFKLNGETVVGRPDEPIITTAKKHGVDIPHCEQVAGHAVGHDFGQATRFCANDGNSARERLECAQAE